MKVRKCLLAAVLAALASGSAAWASAPSSTPTASDPLFLDGSTPTTLTPTMYLLDKTSFGKWMEANNLSITGFAEGGYFYDTSNPRFGTQTPAASNRGDSPTLIGFPGAYSNRGQLDQLDMTIAKTVDTTKPFDFGFQFEQGYGTDDAVIHGYGITDNRAPATIYNKFNANPGAGFPQNQYDIVQANVSVEFSGITVQAGKFCTLLGYETISPLGNQFYTHSYLFTDGIPLTQTGILGSYTFAKLVNGHDLSITAGATRGWNEASSDNNGEIDFLGEAKTNITDKLGLIVNVGEGPESYQYFAGDKGDSHNYWTVLEAIPSYQISDQLTVALDTLYVDFPHGALTDISGTTGLPEGAAAQWYAVAAYASYKLCSYATINARAEWYRDQGGFSVAGANAPLSANYYEGTFGVDIHPFPNNDILQWLQFRPEVRYDLSDRPVYNAAHTGTIAPGGDYGEFTVAMDAIMQF